MQENNIDSWVPFAKQHKESKVQSNPDRGDCPPAVIVEKNDRIQMIVIAPDVDKHLALTAMALLHSALNPDVMTMILDARMQMGKMKEGETEEDLNKKMKEYEPGSMQKKVEAGERGDIVDCLICYRITKDGETFVKNIPYIYEGKDGPPFKWLDEDSEFKDRLNLAEKEGTKVTGLIPDELKKIMELPIFDSAEIENLRKVSESFIPEEREERVFYHSARAIMSLLTAKNYFVVDFVSGTHPEWTGGKENGNRVIEKMVEDGFFPQEAKVLIKELVDEYIATKEFKEKFIALLTENSYWLPATIREDIPKFALEFENICVMPRMPKLDKDGNPIIGSWDDGSDDDDDEDEEDDDEDRYSSGPKSTIWSGTKKPKSRRVKVWNGDKSEYLGEGNYVDDVKVYFIRLEDGSIQSNHNAEIEPEPYQVPPGADIIKAGKNPKIVLDNGDTVYGCQVWWIFSEE